VDSYGLGLYRAAFSSERCNEHSGSKIGGERFLQYMGLAQEVSGCVAGVDTWEDRGAVVFRVI